MHVIKLHDFVLVATFAGNAVHKNPHSFININGTKCRNGDMTRNLVASEDQAKKCYPHGLH